MVSFVSTLLLCIGVGPSGALQPYALCPITPGGSPVDMTPEGLLSRDCCRHYAFCVPYSRYRPCVAFHMFPDVA